MSNRLRLSYCWCTAAAVFALAGPAVAAPPLAYRASLLVPPVGISNTFGEGASGSGFAGFGSGDATNNEHHALAWNDATYVAVDLNPPGFTFSEALAAGGTTQVGWATAPAKADHALLWTGTAESVVDIHPTGYTSSRASGASSTAQVGQGIPQGIEAKPHALLWHGTAASVVDLNPPGVQESVANNVWQSQQAGSVTFAGGNPRAALWNGDKQYVDLHPIGFSSSVALAVGENSVVGYGIGVGQRALLWNGTGDSMLDGIVDLHPAGFYESAATDVLGDTQVGYGILSPVDLVAHALLWKGSLDSVVDLHQYLGDLPVTMIASRAQGIASDGSIVGTGTGSDLRTYALVWRPVPEPGAAALCLGAALAVAIVLRDYGQQRHPARVIS